MLLNEKNEFLNYLEGFGLDPNDNFFEDYQYNYECRFAKKISK
jgi:hypothetical protein